MPDYELASIPYREYKEIVRSLSIPASERVSLYRRRIEGLAVKKQEAKEKMRQKSVRRREERDRVMAYRRSSGWYEARRRGIPHFQYLILTGQASMPDPCSYG